MRRLLLFALPVPLASGCGWTDLFLPGHATSRVNPGSPMRRAVRSGRSGCASSRSSSKLPRGAG